MEYSKSVFCLPRVGETRCACRCWSGSARPGGCPTRSLQPECWKPIAGLDQRRAGEIWPDRYLRASRARSKHSAMAGTWGAIALSTARWSSTPMDICRSIAMSSPATAAWAEVTCWARDVFDSPLLWSLARKRSQNQSEQDTSDQRCCQRMLREASSSIAAIAPFAPLCAEKSICFRMVRRRQESSVHLFDRCVSKHALRIMKDLPPGSSARKNFRLTNRRETRGAIPAPRPATRSGPRPTSRGRAV